MRPAAFLRLQASSSITREPTATLKPPSSQARSALRHQDPDRATPPYGQQVGIRRLSLLSWQGLLPSPSPIVLQEPSLLQRVTGRARRVGQVNVANRRHREPTSGLEPLT